MCPLRKKNYSTRAVVVHRVRESYCVKCNEPVPGTILPPFTTHCGVQINSLLCATDPFTERAKKATNNVT